MFGIFPLMESGGYEMTDDIFNSILDRIFLHENTLRRKGKRYSPLTSIGISKYSEERHEWFLRLCKDSNISAGKGLDGLILYLMEQNNAKVPDLKDMAKDYTNPSLVIPPDEKRKTLSKLNDNDLKQIGYDIGEWFNFYNEEFSKR